MKPAGVGGSMLMRAGAGTEQITQFIVASTEPGRRSWALEPTHRLVSTLDASVILLQSIVEIPAGAMFHLCTQRRPDRTGIAVVAIGGDPVGCDAGDHLGRLEECLRGGHVAVLADYSLRVFGQVGYTGKMLESLNSSPDA